MISQLFRSLLKFLYVGAISGFIQNPTTPHIVWSYQNENRQTTLFSEVYNRYF
jgi:hypothetical protein